eukprot:7461057-Ditylum_brightwellii.AAC.1
MMKENLQQKFYHIVKKLKGEKKYLYQSHMATFITSLPLPTMQEYANSHVRNGNYREELLESEDNNEEEEEEDLVEQTMKRMQ